MRLTHLYKIIETKHHFCRSIFRILKFFFLIIFFLYFIILFIILLKKFTNSILIRRLILVAFLFKNYIKYNKLNYNNLLAILSKASKIKIIINYQF